MAKIVIAEVEDWERDAFDVLCEEHEIEFTPEAIDQENVADYVDADIVSPFIYSELGTDVLQAFDNLKLIATRSTGFDHIDTDYCAENGITVCNVPDYGQNTVAEHVFGLLLAISHNLVDAVDRTRRGDFSLKGLRGFDLQGKTLGVIGTGSIGEHVIRIANGFGMHVVAYDVAKREELARELGFEYVQMEELLGRSDVVTLHVPDTPQTHHMISTKEFGQMKRGAVVINTSRGGLVNVNALVQALASGQVAAAGLDVLADEPTIREEAELIRRVYREEHDLQTLLSGHILLRLRNVIITPHSAFYTVEATERILETTIENVQAFSSGEPQNVIVPRER